MTEKHTPETAKVALSPLQDKILTNIKSQDGTLELTFAEIQNESNQITLTIATNFRFTLRQIILIAKQDLFLPSHAESHKENFNIENFNDYENGQTRFAEQIERYFTQNTITDFIVTDIETHDFADFTLTFQNQAQLQITTDTSYNEPSWFIENHIVKPYNIWQSEIAKN